jgi:hypothetical protein
MPAARWLCACHRRFPHNSLTNKIAGERAAARLTIKEFARTARNGKVQAQ